MPIDPAKINEVASKLPFCDTVLKFNPDGTRKPFAGNTVICHLPVQPAMRDAMVALHDDLTHVPYFPMLGLLDRTFKESFLGRAEVINVIRILKVGAIAGCRVSEGVLRRDAEMRLMRGTEQVFKGKVSSLRHFKDDVKEVTNGMECGVGLAGFSDSKEGDVIEAFTTERMACDLGQLATTVAAAAKETVVN